MKEIKAYKTVDGKLFESKEYAEKHEEIELININRNLLFQSNLPLIKKLINKNYDDTEFRGDKPKEEDLNFHNDGEYGWDCDSKDSPIDKCIYSDDIRMGDDTCVYCGQPEERK
tara:strand:- start:204 stop:545 length:342 start_codon:yes stop_codon:yes gene_type:complete